MVIAQARNSSVAFISSAIKKEEVGDITPCGSRVSSYVLKGCKMKARYIALIVASIAAMSLLFASSAGAATGMTATATSLSDPSALQPQTVYFSDGSSATMTVDPINTAPLTLTSTGYYCGDVGYGVKVYWNNVFGWNMWTYHSVQKVHVCNDTVRYKVIVYDEPINTFYGWSWCGHILNNWVNYSYESQSYTKGCFTVLAQGIISTKYPWVKITIGGNGGLWAESWSTG